VLAPGFLAPVDLPPLEGARRKRRINQIVQTTRLNYAAVQENYKNDKRKMRTGMTTSRLMLAAIMVVGAIAVQAQTTSTNQTATNATPAHPKVVMHTNSWKSTIALGLTLARGNTDTTLASASATTEKKWPENDLLFGADGLYGETKDPNAQKYSENAEVLHGYSQYNRTITDGFYGYARIDGFHDGIAAIKYRLTVAPGVGYFFITNKITDLSGEIGPGYIKEQLDGKTESFATLRIAEKFHYAISAHSKAWEAVEILPQLNNFNNYILNSEVGIEAGLNKGNNLSLRSVLQDSYNNVPAAGRLKNDLKLITSLVYKF
jgi:putative salt-induced outer membrane protein YdiY